MTAACTAIAGAVEIAVAELDLGQQAVGRRVAAGDEEVAGRLVDRLDVEHDAIRRRARLGRDLDGLEVVQVLQPPLGAVDQGLVVGIAFGEFELAADHVVAGAGVAVDVDALDIGPLALLDHEGDVDALCDGIARDAGRGMRKGIAELRHLDGERLGGLVQRAAVEHRAVLRQQEACAAFRDRAPARCR